MLNHDDDDQEIVNVVFDEKGETTSRSRTIARPFQIVAAEHNMAFMMMKKKRYKFQVDLCLDELGEVVYSKAILFAKIRQLDGGNFTDVSKRYTYFKNQAAL